MQRFLSLAILLLISTSMAFAGVIWSRKSSIDGDIPVPNAGSQQTCCLVLDIDKDGKDDFVVGERTKAPSVVWFSCKNGKWNRYIIDNTRLNPEAGGAYFDIDGDGDLDIVLGQDASGNQMWWWENPYPNYGKPWTRRLIKNDGPNKHHDQTFADYDGDGKVELVSWNQLGKRLLWFEIPDDPKATQPWPYKVIYTWDSGNECEGFPSKVMDIDLDGKVDIVGGGRWFKHKSGTEFEAHVIDDAKRFTQCAVGQLVEGGRPEIVFSPGDMDGTIVWYEWNGSEWQPHPLRFIVHGHTCEIRDVDQDGHQDLMIGEMGQPGAANSAKTYIWYGDGKGNFRETIASQGQGIHEGLFGDFDGDSDLDLLMKPYHHKAPRIDILMNQGTKHLSLTKWKRHHIADLPKRAMFVDAGDLDNDGKVDLVAGGYWWKNPGHVSGEWIQKVIGEPLRNMTLLYDFDADADLDVLGTEGVGSDKNNKHVWAQNDGKGGFKIIDNIDRGGDGDFLQGRAILDMGSKKTILLSWHNDGGGVQSITAPRKPAEERWTFDTVCPFSEKEDLDLGDIDRDGDLDVLMGMNWLRNEGGSWTRFEIGKLEKGEADRNELADVNGDGRLDAIIGLELHTDVFWMEAPADPTKPWTKHIIGTSAGQGFSMDAGDLDNDGDPDVVLGEHRGESENRVMIFENQNRGASWSVHIIDKDSKDFIDHHDGTQLVDLDFDGDLDIISVGWYNPKIWIFENLARE